VAAGNAEIKSGNGFIVLIPPDPGLTGLSGGAEEPNEFDRISEWHRSIGRERRPDDGSLETGSRRQ